VNDERLPEHSGDGRPLPAAAGRSIARGVALGFLAGGLVGFLMVVVYLLLR
jgi:hypothetical protein